MSGSGSQQLLIVAIVGIAIFSLLWQVLDALRRRGRQDAHPHALFWTGLFAWVVLGLLLHDAGCCRWLPAVWRWLLPAAGLLGTAVVCAAREMPRFLTEERGASGDRAEAEQESGGEEHKEEEDLDAEDKQLLGRLDDLLRKRAADLMVPVSEVPCVTEESGLGAVLELLTAGKAMRIPVLDSTRSRPLGIIDGRDLISRLFAKAPAAPEPVSGPTAPGSVSESTAPASGDPEPLAGRICKQIPRVPSREPAKKALEALRAGTGGVSAVVDPKGRVIGFLAWQPIFRALVGRRSKGGAL